jgi:hypothetical protein
MVLMLYSKKTGVRM